ncbi:hypothetical protein BD324DRAFT_124059 [Kockovaella imperatae]|uniref:Uncharacterized protein n=1 Tax=Kockovaella imperatae TaxID=4999 RepID=A0A1Y1U9F2_9TREE|nr:hypothetical protein BD324DRAFT_124059 [Kockovaella imperatae]ORX34642.1 hypothetical protein BD324DRAFT_124059 [Kockovaella imperatae]
MPFDGSCVGFLGYSILERYVKYTEGFIPIPGMGIEPKPYLLWGSRLTRIYRVSIWMTVFAFSAMSAVHLEEILYWVYMIRACRKNGSAHWFQTIWFKIWVAGSVICTGIFFGCTGINPDFAKIETNLYLSASLVSLVLVVGSGWTSYLFPQFIAEARRLGANQDVLGRLLYVNVLNNLRTTFRVAYVVILLTLSVDGLTEAQKINNNRFALDVLMIAGYFSIFAAETISLWVSCLLPSSPLIVLGPPTPQECPGVEAGPVASLRSSGGTSTRQCHRQDRGRRRPNGKCMGRSGRSTQLGARPSVRVQSRERHVYQGSRPSLRTASTQGTWCSEWKRYNLSTRRPLLQRE